MESDETKNVRAKSKDYPGVTLESAIKFIEKLKGYPMNKPISYEIAAKDMGVSMTTRSFTVVLSAARQFGLISTSESKILFSEAAKRFAYPDGDILALKKLKISCFTTPKLYGELIGYYKGKPLPLAKTLENVLVVNHGIVPSVANSAAQVFIDTAREVGAIKGGILDLEVIDDENGIKMDEKIESVNTKEIKKETLSDSEKPLDLESKEGFESPLVIPFGNRRKAILYMPIETTREDAEYAKKMIISMFRQLYGIDNDTGVNSNQSEV